MNAEQLTAMVESVKVMQLRPGDVIVVRLAVSHISPEQADTIKRHLKPLFGDHEILVLDDSADVEIVRAEECAA